MIKYWQPMQDYKYFLNESKVHFDSSERVRLHTELWKPWQKLRLFDTDKAMEFLLPFYSNTGRPAKNQPQILRSFILFFLLFSEGLAKPSLTLWVDSSNTTASLPPSSAALRIPCRPSVLILTSWTGPGLHRQRTYMRGTNCFRLPGTAKSRISPKAKNGKHRRQSPKSQKLSKNGSWAGRISLLTLRGGCSASSIMWPSCLPWNPVSYQGNTLRFLETAPPCIPMPAHAGTTGLAHRKACGISPTPMLPGAGTATWKNITSATPCSNYPAITVNSGQTSRCSCVLPAQGGMIRSISLSLSMNWKNICRLFPSRICAWILQWTITPPTGFLKTGEYGPSST